MDAVACDIEVSQAVIERLHDEWRAAQAEIVVVERQNLLEQLGNDPATLSSDVFVN